MPTVTPRLLGRRALVTGAGSGIGLATAVRLVGDGAALAVLDARADGVSEALEAVRAAGGDALGLVADVGTESEMVDAVGRTARHLGGLDTVVSCAGIARAGRTHELALAEWETMLRVNLTGTFLTLREALPHLLAADRSSIVTIGSVASLVAAGGVSAYDASKGGVLQLTRAVAVEYADRGVRANCICPGFVATGLRANTAALYGAQPAVSPGAEPSARVHVPMERRADPAEIAAVAAFLCSDDSSFITGAAIAADGGYTAV
jgi:3-oxoacyl-[acyl-carrier protein] reductase